MKQTKHVYCVIIATTLLLVAFIGGYTVPRSGKTPAPPVAGIGSAYDRLLAESLRQPNNFHVVAYGPGLSQGVFVSRTSKRRDELPALLRTSDWSTENLANWSEVAIVAIYETHLFPGESIYARRMGMLMICGEPQLVNELAHLLQGD